MNIDYVDTRSRVGTSRPRPGWRRRPGPCASRPWLNDTCPDTAGSARWPSHGDTEHCLYFWNNSSGCKFSFSETANKTQMKQQTNHFTCFSWFLLASSKTTNIFPFVTPKLSSYHISTIYHIHWKKRSRDQIQLATSCPYYNVKLSQ